MTDGNKAAINELLKLIARQNKQIALLREELERLVAMLRRKLT